MATIKFVYDSIEGTIDCSGYVRFGNAGFQFSACNAEMQKFLIGYLFKLNTNISKNILKNIVD